MRGIQGKVTLLQQRSNVSRWRFDSAMNTKYFPMTTTLPEPQSVDFERPLGGLEHFFWLLDQHRPVHFAMAAHVEGHTEVSSWRTALDAAQRRHPLLSVAIQAEAVQGPRFRTVADARVPLRIADAPPSRWRFEVAKELTAPFDAQRAPLVRAVLMQAQNESVLIVVAHHSIADGLSVSYVVRDILQALQGEDLQPLDPLPAEEPLVYASQPHGVTAEQAGQPESPQEGRSVSFRVLHGALPAVEALSLPPDVTSKLIERARKERTTVHGALSAALVLAGREISDDWACNPVRVLSPFNLRKQIGVDDDCGVFVWAAGVAMPTDWGTDFWEMARFAKSSLTTKQSIDRVATEMHGVEQAIASGIDVPTAAQILAQGFPCELLLTNLGALQFDSCDLRPKALWGPSVLMGFEGEQTVGVTTVNGSLCLLHTSFAPISGLLRRAELILRSACE
jgi:hypothetical protein